MCKQTSAHWHLSFIYCAVVVGLYLHIFRKFLSFLLARKKSLFIMSYNDRGLEALRCKFICSGWPNTTVEGVLAAHTQCRQTKYFHLSPLLRTSTPALLLRLVNNFPTNFNSIIRKFCSWVFQSNALWEYYLKSSTGMLLAIDQHTLSPKVCNAHKYHVPLHCGMFINILLTLWAT